MRWRERHRSCPHGATEAVVEIGRSSYFPRATIALSALAPVAVARFRSHGISRIVPDRSPQPRSLRGTHRAHGRSGRYRHRGTPARCLRRAGTSPFSTRLTAKPAANRLTHKPAASNSYAPASLLRNGGAWREGVLDRLARRAARSWKSEHGQLRIAGHDPARSPPTRLSRLSSQTGGRRPARLARPRSEPRPTGCRPPRAEQRSGNPRRRGSHGVHTERRRFVGISFRPANPAYAATSA